MTCKQQTRCQPTKVEEEFLKRTYEGEVVPDIAVYFDTIERAMIYQVQAAMIEAKLGTHGAKARLDLNRTVLETCRADFQVELKKEMDRGRGTQG